MKRRYKFMLTGFKSKFNGYKWTPGEWHKTECKELCHGFNCSDRIIDAMRYVRGEILCVVETRGNSFLGDDKSTWEEMRIVKSYKWTKTESVSLAIFAAELVIDIFEKERPNDDRPRKAIEAAKSSLFYPDPNAAANAANAASNAADALNKIENYLRGKIKTMNQIYPVKRKNDVKES